MVLVLVFVISLGFCGCIGTDQVKGNLTYVGVPCEKRGECPDLAVPKVDDYYLLKEPYEGYSSYLPHLEKNYYNKEIVVSGSKTTFEVDNTTYKAIISSNENIKQVTD
ncbi:MAG: hypothetical protein BTN85_0251 [Candidatus Methanohalarchaeum thermophilum]|uniref:Uncharacterized protein n=1 Tax=Methanohalarchaeum thermophilum TaxID=1903181 RepID=A0A1Q6DTY4_METT1|nr:MAG: hypothetical protein BTN85_0251 [Candidatus Methanohalarchaeum thermophilum]